MPVQACIVHHDGTTPHAAASSFVNPLTALVNIVRKQEQVDLLTKLGAKFVVNSSSESFKKYLYKAIDATGETLAFDAIGGGIKGSEYLISKNFSDCVDFSGYSILL
ncbi:Alcohol dehydrogenase GroES-like, fragment [Oleispira antarctica RB-8]|uniref:Alcohol dehydrogenase GroES-like n=1 Tax=Oleispira antarctica RB-8 TaxID=698738 RepID=R4YV44_OLEAN|nr:Alcohol dehydrogenase GroES-like, fragment [Oleispira antarctica RB-8]